MDFSFGLEILFYLFLAAVSCSLYTIKNDDGFNTVLRKVCSALLPILIATTMMVFCFMLLINVLYLDKLVAIIISSVLSALIWFSTSKFKYEGH